VTVDDLYVEPMLATLVREPFDDPDWLFETKWDGFRVEACIAGGEVRLWTRGRKDAAGYFGAFLSPPTWLDAAEAILDGEVVALDEHGQSDFGLLQQRIGRSGARTSDRRVVYQAFDLLYVDGASLIDLPLEERKARLRAVVRDDHRVLVSDHVIGEGRAFFEVARERRLEGMVAKERHSPYLPGRRAATWLKIKIRPEQELVVVGWTTGIGYATDLGALLVAVNEDGGLRYVGKVGAGFNKDSRAELVERLVPLAVADPAVDNPPTGKLRRDARWVRPELVIRAEFAGWTGDGNVRQASYKGIEVSKAAADVVREVPRMGRAVRP
jgi:bifunctional non-homologous end joining protein LigD